MTINWIFKYYFIGFIAIFSLYYYIENSEPYVDWALYTEISESKVKRIIKERNCLELVELYESEYNENYQKNFLGFNIRKEKKLIRGLNLLKYLEYNIDKISCDIA